MEDDGGQDEKILAVPVHKLTAMYDNVHDIGDMQPIQVERVKHFFTHYKDLEPGKWAKIEHIGDVDEARRVILESIEPESDWRLTARLARQVTGRGPLAGRLERQLERGRLGLHRLRGPAHLSAMTRVGVSPGQLPSC